MRYLSSGCTADIPSSRRPRLLFFLSVWLFTFPGGVSALAQNEAAKNDASDARAARMDAMRRRANSLEVWSRGAAAMRVDLLDTALLRYSSLTGEPATADGSIWAWGESGRPAALGAIFFERIPTGDVKWSCELLSLSDGKLGVEPNVGRSVVFSDESEGRPFAFHTIVVNSENSSTTLIITRGKDEAHTRITWKQYVKHEVGG